MMVRIEDNPTPALPPDPRLNLLAVDGKSGVLERSGSRAECASTWGNDAVYDMVGNLDEWVSDEKGTFRGGFYARGTTEGCDARIAAHTAVYYDYSLGVRCCRDAR